MRVIENKTIYRCEHGNCKKYLLTEHAMKKHEIHCKHNPKNDHKCFHFCKHLEKGRYDEGGTYFLCKATGKEMWSYKIEKSAMFHEATDTCDIRMPLTCEKYESMEMLEDFADF